MINELSRFYDVGFTISTKFSGMIDLACLSLPNWISEGKWWRRSLHYPFCSHVIFWRNGICQWCGCCRLRKDEQRRMRIDVCSWNGTWSFRMRKVFLSNDGLSNMLTRKELPYWAAFWFKRARVTRVTIVEQRNKMLLIRCSHLFTDVNKCGDSWKNSNFHQWYWNIQWFGHHERTYFIEYRKGWSGNPIHNKERMKKLYFPTSLILIDKGK